MSEVPEVAEVLVVPEVPEMAGGVRWREVA